MAKPQFGRLEKVALQDIWHGNGDEFLEWISQPENLVMLGEILGMELQLESLKRGPDPANSFLLCREAGSHYWVVVLNPVGTTDNAYLGRVLAHSAAYNPVHTVWLAGEISQDHRVVMDWLNSVTQDVVNMFGVEIVFWKIGGSAYAPKFSLVNGPAAWVAAASTTPQVPQPAQPQVMPDPFKPPPAPPAKPAPPPAPVSTDESVQDTRTTSGMLRAAAASKDQEPSSGLLGRKARGSTDVDGGATPDPEPPQASNGGQGMFDQEAPVEQAVKVPQTAPSGNPPAESGNNSGALRDFQASETTVTPSGMLQRLRMTEKKEVDSGVLTRPATGDLTDLEKVYLDFWAQFWEDVVQWGSELPPEKPMSQGWVTFPIGREHFYLIAFINADHNLAGMGLVMEGGDAKAYYHLLRQEKDNIEAEIGSVLDWRELPSKDESHIYLHKRNVDPFDRERWAEYHGWFAETLETFTHVLGTRVRTLDAADYWDQEAIYKRM